jgi:hypothetical protein
MSLQEGIAASQNLLSVDSNLGGGTPKYKEHCDKLLKVIDEFPPALSAQKSKVKDLMDAMNHRYSSKTVGTWRPFVACMIVELGGCEEDWSKICRVNPESIKIAKTQAEAFPNGEKAEWDRKRGLSLVTKSTTGEKAEKSKVARCTSPKSPKAESSILAAIENIDKSFEKDLGQLPLKASELEQKKARIEKLVSDLRVDENAKLKEFFFRSSCAGTSRIGDSREAGACIPGEFFGRGKS